MRDVLDAAAVRRWSRDAVASLDAHRAEIDRLNVFPVHDSDTGTNLVTTLRAASAALEADPTDDAPAALRTLARGAVLGASGNSGNILAQLLRGLAEAAGEFATCDADALREGLRRGADQARAAVAEPVEGTILSVADAAAAAVAEGATVAQVAVAALAGALEALRRTPEQLAALARAGVVDAGGQGLVIVLEALATAVGGERPVGAAPARVGPLPAVAADPDPGVPGPPAFEVQYLLDAPPRFDEAQAVTLRAQLARLGDSALVVGTGDGIWSVHVHTDDAGAALEAGIAVGRPYRISVARLDEPQAPSKPTAVIAVAPGGGSAGLARMFEREGVRVVRGGAAGPDVAEVVAAALAADAGDVVLLADGERAGAVAEAAAERARARGVRVAVVPTESPVQALAAVAVHDPARRFDDDVVAMAEAAGATRFAEVTLAEHDSLTSAGVCRAGDVLGLIDGEVVEIGHGVLAAALAVTDRLLGVGAELMTVLVSADLEQTVGEVVRRHVRERAPFTEVSVYPVDRPSSPLVIGVE